MDFSYRIRALATRYEVTVLARAEIIQRELMVKGVRYTVIPTRDCGTLQHVLYALKVAGHIRNSAPNLVVYLGSQMAAAILLAKGMSSAVYWNEHPAHYFESTARDNAVVRIIRGGLRALTYRGARYADVVMPIGEAHADDLLAHGVPTSKLRIIYMGVSGVFGAAVEMRRRAQREKEGRPLELIYTGTVIKERGRDVMLEALSLVNRDRIRARLTLVGAAPEQIAYCRQRAEELGIVDQLDVRGRIPGDEIPAVLAQADVGICIWEDRVYWRFNPPTKLFEYLVAGMPVLASRIQTHTAYIRDWENGLIFDYGAESLAQQIESLWVRRKDMPSLSARAAASGQTYLWEKLEPTFLDALPGGKAT